MPVRKTLSEDLFYRGSSANLPRLHTCENKIPFWDFSQFAVTIFTGPINTVICSLNLIGCSNSSKLDSSVFSIIQGFIFHRQSYISEQDYFFAREFFTPVLNRRYFPGGILVDFYNGPDSPFDFQFLISWFPIFLNMWGTF